ncbi:MAG: LD-carboxypeptidase [Betaproteobacteria bacterium]|nr:LD-carboxypeptidase [Betaproteobacteria bacterium]
MPRIYLYSPAGAVRDRTAFQRGVRRLKALGYEVEVDEAALARHQRFAGDDATRLAALRRAAASGADLAMISRGGYGLTRILADLPYKALAKAIERGTRFVGLSDFTALQCAVLARTQAPTWAGPALMDDFAAPEPGDEITLACLEDLATGRGEGTGWRLPASEAGHWTVRKAIVWGGNLSVLCALVGTPYLPSVKGGILFIEDVNEHPYRIERMLSQLLHAGVLAQQKAIMFGQFSNYRLVAHDRGFKLSSVVDWLRTRVRARVLTGLPFGHVATKVILPVGRLCDLVVQEREALLLWGADA